MQFYLSLKCLHIVGVISWMAGILYFFRLFVYHVEFGRSNESIHVMLSLMEKRLYYYITLPAMVISVGSGLWMMGVNPYLNGQRWFQLKLIGALFLIGITGYGWVLLKNFKQQKFHTYSSRYFRILNEVPTLCMIWIVVMVIFRPFLSN